MAKAKIGFTAGSDEATSALFARIPVGEAEKLERAAFALRLPKQEIVARLVARYLDPSKPGALEALRSETPLVVEPERLALGRHAFEPASGPEVLTAEDAAALLMVDVRTVLDLARRGELPGRKVGRSWRFSRSAVLDWLARRDA